VEIGFLNRPRVKVDWERILGKKGHSEAPRRSNLIRGGWKGNPSFLVTVLDNFNDLLIQRLSLKHPKLKGPLERRLESTRFPDLGSWLNHADLTSVLSTSQPLFDSCHKKRVIAEVAHATIKKTGQCTRPLGYKEAQKVVTNLRPAYLELLGEFSNL
jgi:hypothetical protein